VRQVTSSTQLAHHVTVAGAQRRARNHFGHDETGAITFRYFTERAIGDSSHWREECAVSNSVPTNAQCEGII
jgi:hypothetical protein